MKYIEVTKEVAIELLKKSEGQTVMVAIHDLENDEEDVVFTPTKKKECEPMFKGAKTITSKTDDFIKQLNIFSEKQIDLENIKNRGVQKIILLK